jgi:hypothetical protein
MARFSGDIEQGILGVMQKMEGGSEKIMAQMVEAGADVALRNIRGNMRSSFKTTRSLEAGLGKTRVYKTRSDDGINVKVGFRGYSPYNRTRTFSSGVPIPLIAIAREKGTRRGIKAKPFFKKSFNKAQIEAAMRAIEPKLWEGAQ